MIFFIIFIVYGCEDLHKEDFLLEDNFVTQKLTRAKEQDYYWYKGQKVFMEKQNNKVFTLKEKSKNINAFKRELEWSVGSYETMKTTEDVVYTSNVYSTPKGEDLFFTNLFFVKLKETTEYSQLVSLATQNNVNILGHAADMDLWYKLECNPNSKGTAVEMANLFYETGLFQYSHPDLVFEVKDAGEIVSESTHPRPNDTYFNKQWHLYDSINNRDINFLQARQITQGDSTIKIAVIENGLPNFSHEDLEIFKSGNLVFSSYEESVQYTLGNTSQADNLKSSHATACVGIIAATPNNNKGVTGIAPDCSIISIATGSTVSSQHYSVAENIARAFNIAQNNNAAVVSCSWYCSVTEDYGQDIIEDAISNIILQGRESKGSVVVFAAGNGSNSPVS